MLTLQDKAVLASVKNKHDRMVRGRLAIFNDDFTEDVATMIELVASGHEKELRTVCRANLIDYSEAVAYFDSLSLD